MKPAGEFDNDYRKKIQDACLKAILEASIDPATNTVMLRNAEVSNALLRIMAVLAATSKSANSPTQIRQLAEEFAKDFRKLVTTNKASLDKEDGLPFPVLHQGELQ
jgi:Pyruvate/2-oxoacid:ferredoxin oxidoreductase gamma subunit